jgi:predicted AlkP superfamily phosphohydrolase/phosphomutase
MRHTTIMNGTHTFTAPQTTDGIETSDGTPKVLVVGLDGAGFDLLAPWIDAGELPTLERIVDDGVSGPLRSVLPPVTSPNWKAYATGKNPGKLGIFWWKNVDVDDRRIYVPQERYHQHTEFWEIIAEREPVGVLGVPLTYPPTDLDAFFVSGAPDAEERGYAQPPAVERELRDELDYRINSQYRRQTDPGRACDDEIRLIDMRFEAAKYLLEEYDVSFLQLSTFYINQFHHYLWDDEETLRAWKRIDDHLADLLDSCHNLVLMSDHGHNEIHSVFRINQWLEAEGYLALDQSVASGLYSLGIDKELIKTQLARVGRSLPVDVNLVSLADQYVPPWLLKYLPDEDGEVGPRTAAPIVWERTDAVASAQGPIYLTVDRSSPRHEELRAELTRKLERLTDPQGRPVVDEVRRSEDVYTGAYLDEAPDLLLDQADNVHIRESLGDKPIFSRRDSKWNGVNNRAGLFAATGPLFTTGTIDDMSILDLAPTLLHLYECPIPDDMDGRVRQSILQPELRSTTD